MDLDYSDVVRRHFRAPVGAGRPDWPADAQGQGGQVQTGIAVRFWLKFDGERIAKAAFAAYGCPHTIATASWLCERLPGRSLAEACRIDLDTVVAELELPPAKWRCVLVAEDALRDCESAKAGRG